MAMYRVNKNLCAFSPSGEYLALGLQQELSIKNSKTLNDHQSFTSADTIEFMEWSPNGKYILCANSSHWIIQIFSLNRPGWKWKLTEGSAGFNSIAWAPDSKSIIITSDLDVFLSIWKLDDRTVTHIWNLKSSVPSIAINGVSQRLAVIVSNNGADNVEIYKIGSWKLTRKLICDKLFGIDGISWSPNGEFLGIWCSTIEKSRLLIYSVITDAHVGAYSGDEAANKFPQTIRGIKNIAWCSSGQLLAVVGFNETVVIINHITWSVLLQLHCSPVINEGNYLERVFKELTISGRNSTSANELQKHTMEEVNERPINITISVELNNWDISIAAIDIMEFSPCGKYLAIRHQLYPTTLWIWDLLEDSVDYVLLNNSISGIAWARTKPKLLILSESSIIVEWRPIKKALCFKSPQDMKVLLATWQPNDEKLALHGYKKSWVINFKY